MGSYGALEDLARNRVNLNKAIAHWREMLRVAGSLVTNQIRAYDLLRMFGRERRPPRWGRRSPSTGASPRPSTCSAWSTRSTAPTARQMNRQLTVQESRHKLAHDVCHGKRGTIHQA